ncbi:MAG: SMC family ATPase [Candidatus Nanopelagicales bacterium]|nr:SMC family ATPase [Candidatus Nanopelagicales bacterium]
MRVHTLEFEGIGPFRDRQIIDFDSLGQSGIFLIDGPTGAGKTTIIDAIVFALYGDVSGREADSSRLRSAFSLPQEPSEVAIEFSVGGRKVWLKRTPRYQRAKKSGEGTTDAAATQLLREMAQDGSVTAELTTAHEIGIHINQLLGMNAQQFRQLVVLPQGEFAELLRMKPSERFAALGPLLGDVFYKQLQDDLDSQGALAKGQRSAADLAVANAIQQIMGALGDLSLDPELIEATELLMSGTPTTEIMGGCLVRIEEWLATRNKQLKKELAVAKKKATEAQVQAQRANEYQAGVLAVIAATQACAAALEKLETIQDHFTREDAQSEQEELIQLLARLEPILERELNLETWITQVQELNDQIDVQQSKLKEFSELTQNAPAERSRLEQTIAAYEVLAAMVNQRESDVLILQGKAASLKKLEILELELAGIARDAVNAHEQVGQLEQGLLDSRSELDALLRQQLHDRAAFLASALNDDQRCPVCGSHEHPNPAVFSGEPVSDESIEELRISLETLQEQLDAAKAQSAKVATDEQALVVNVAELRGSVMGETSESITEALEAAQIALNQTKTASDALPALREEIEELKTREETIDESMQQVRNEITKLTTQLEQLVASHQQQEQADREVLGSAATAADLSRSTQDRIEALGAFRKADEQLALAKAGLPALDENLDVEFWLEQVAITDKEATSALSAVEQKSGLVLHAAALFTNPKNQLLTAMSEHQELFDRTSPAIALAEAVTAGKTSFNLRRITLQSYAVQRRFESVLDAASIHLSRMSGGKYSLELDDVAKGNAQSGLGIKVSDAWSGQSRDPRSLSGGETFYTALSLALGLADVVRDEAGGSQLETLFVDEGFGSLDQESLQLVLEQLDALRSGGRIVGVVSHVTEMKDWVHDRIEVQVTADRTSKVKTLL